MKPTTLISVTDKLSRTIRRALNVQGEREAAEDIWVALIYVCSAEGPAQYPLVMDLDLHHEIDSLQT